MRACGRGSESVSGCACGEAGKRHVCRRDGGGAGRARCVGFLSGFWTDGGVSGRGERVRDRDESASGRLLW